MFMIFQLYLKQINESMYQTISLWTELSPKSCWNQTIVDLELQGDLGIPGSSVSGMASMAASDPMAAYYARNPAECLYGNNQQSGPSVF